MAVSRRFLILTSGFGEGHNAAARNVGEALKRCSPGAEVEVRDVMAETHPRLGRVLMKGYLWVIRYQPWLWVLFFRWTERGGMSARPFWFSRLRRRLAEVVEGADAVVSTYPFYGHLLDEMEGQVKWSGVVVTDSISVHRSWYAPGVNRYFVTDEASKGKLRAMGVEGDIAVTGFPVSHEVALTPSLESARWVPGEPFRVLCFASSSPDNLEETLAGMVLAGIEKLEVTLLLGRSGQGQREIGEVFFSRYPELAGELIGWTNQVPELMRSHHLVVSKAGGATTHESIQSARPLLFCGFVPGQEEGNVQLVVEAGGGVLAVGSAEVARALRAIVGEGAEPGTWRAMQEAMAKLAKPHPAEAVARSIIESLSA